MRCDEARLALLALEDGELDAAGRSDLVAHLERCSGCRRERQADQRVKALVRQHASTSPAAPPDLWSRVVKRLEAERTRVPKGGRRLARIRPARWASALAAAVAAMVVLGVSLQWMPSPSTSAELLDELVNDHVGSLHRAGGPAAVLSGDPAVILARFADRISGPASIPRLEAGSAALIGGSFCQLSTTRGVRWTYRLRGDRTFSFYQLARPARGDLPRPRAERITLAGGTERTGLVLWTDERAVYALVGTLPQAEMQALAARF